MLHLLNWDGGALPLFVTRRFKEIVMPAKLKMIAVAAVLAAGTSGAAMAQSTCPPGYALYGSTCQPVPTQAYPAAPAPAYPSGPLSGAASGGAAGAARGSAAAGPVGAIVGGALGTATGTIAGTANAVSGAANAVAGNPAPTPTCAAGYTYYNGACYPATYNR